MVLHNLDGAATEGARATEYLKHSEPVVPGVLTNSAMQSCSVTIACLFAEVRIQCDTTLM
jgi:hypothetical protein